MEESVGSEAVESEVIGEAEEVEATAVEVKVEEKEAGLCVVEDGEEEDGINVRIV